jgi:hypothetical protein
LASWPQRAIFAAYSSNRIFRDINPPGARGLLRMESEKVAGIVAAIVAAVVLVIAFAYGPIGQFGKPAQPAAVQQPAQPAPAAPGVRGPVIREVPN